jgi:hypothetical protein
MVDELIDLMPDFPGKVNHTRCFAHVLNLVAKTVIKQFDAPKKGLFDLNDEELVLADLAAGIELEEDEMRAKVDNDEDMDNEEGWIDEELLLSEDERSQLRASLLPIRLVIVKVSLLQT